MNLALFGGSFDPPHFGHKMIIEEALHVLKINKLIVMPTFLNPFKDSSHFDSNTRLKMTKDICKDFKNVEISDYEVQQQKKVPTIDTVKHLYNKYNIDKLYLIIGADNLAKLHLWKDFKELETLVEFVIASRDNIKHDTEYKVLDIQCDISSTKIREDLDTLH